MNPITINNVEYYHTADLMNTDKEYFKCCKGKPRAILEWKKIPDTAYIFAYQKDGKWIVSKKEYCKSFLLLTKSFCEANLPSMKKIEPEVVQVVEKKVEKKSEAKPLVAPPILELLDNEKFKDEKGKLLDIEVRGERKVNSVYFKVKDIAREFEMKNLRKTLLDSRNNLSYTEGKHYVFFYCIVDSEMVKTLYLTYNGLIRCLFVSKNVNAESFQSWATEVLFTHQMGTVEQKNDLACGLLGVPYPEVKKYLGIQSGDIYCIYLSILGKVSSLRDSMQIHPDVDDEKMVCKFGRTDNLEQRIANHKSEFKSIRGTQLQLRKIASIDPFHSSKAETDLKHYVNKFKLEFEQKEELIVVDKKELAEVEDRMYFLSLRYGGSKQEIAGLLDKANLEIDRLNNEIEKKNLQIQVLEEKYQNKELERKLAQQELKYFKLKMGIQE